MAFRFRNFPVYQQAKQLHLDIFTKTKTWNYNYSYLADQIRRSSLSIMLNIAEGSSKQSDKDFNRFITISLGSIDETIACLEIAKDLELLSEQDFEKLEAICIILSKQLGGFSKKLKQI